VFYTDGLVEAFDGSGEQFGYERLEAAIRESAANDAPGGKIVAEVTEQVKKFTGGYFQDDVLLMVARVKNLH
jgi:serine phosphatase RsbU (regulator of sigma subunit)